MSPTVRLLALALAWLLLAGVVVLVPALVSAWAWLGGATALCVVADAVWVCLFRLLAVRRQLPARFAFGEPGEVGLLLRNDGGRVARIRPSLIIEVGTWKGGSALELASHLDRLDLSGSRIQCSVWKHHLVVRNIIRIVCKQINDTVLTCNQT